MTQGPATRAKGGFALLEVLIAAGVLGFGLLALAKAEFGVFGTSDLAKQRSEAVQIGEQKMEELRSFAQLAGYAAMRSSADTVAGTSSTFTRTWTVADAPFSVVGGSYPTYKDVTMVVSWTSRSSTGESVKLQSLIAMADPASAGQLVVPPSGSPTREPNNRAINIPWPAVKLGNGTSAFRPIGALPGVAFIFNDVTGAVVYACTSATLPGSDNTSGTPTDIAPWGCTAISGLLVAGYIGVPRSNPPPVNFHLDLAFAANTSVSGTASLFGCYDDIGEEGTGTQLYTGYVTYACIVNAADGAWSGSTAFTGETFGSPPTVVSWGTSNGQWFVCRYSANSPAYPYVDVKKSLENQNYVLVQGSNRAGCPTGTVQSYPPAL